MVEEVEDEVPTPHVYSTTSPSFAIQLSSGTVQAAGGLLKLADHQEKELQRLMKSGRPDLVQNLRKLDLVAAAKKAEEALKEMQKPAAVRGTKSSDANPLSQVRREKILNTPEALNNGVSEPFPTKLDAS